MASYQPSLWADDEPFEPMRDREAKRPRPEVTRGGKGMPAAQRRPSILSPEAWEEEEQQGRLFDDEGDG
jgi:hypothetical protein